MSEINIVGAGLVGSLLAIVLREKGYEVNIFERYNDIRQAAPVGRSINLVATARGLRALNALPRKIKDQLLELGTKVTGRIIHPKGGEEIFQRYGKDDSEFNYSISRYELNKFLLSRAEEAGAKLHFDHKLIEMELNGDDAFPTLTFAVGRGDATKTVVVECSGPLVAADGGGSAVRQALHTRGLCAYTSELLDSGYKEMTFPLASAKGMARHGLHIWPRGDHFIMGLANMDGSFTGTLYLTNKGATDSFAAIDEGGVPAAKAFLETHYAEAVPLLGGIEHAARMLLDNPTGILGTVRTVNWAIGGKVVLIGDAAHAIVPFFGQGMNSGFEDVKDLVGLLMEHAPPAATTTDTAAAGTAAATAAVGSSTYSAAFAAFETARRPNANAIADMALENYVEMMASTADPTFRKRKAVENALENSSLGSRFRSRYAMVCYGGAGNVSYHAAQTLGRVQWEIVSELADGVASVETAPKEIDLTKAAALLDKKLEPVKKKLAVDLTTVSHAD